MPAVSPLRAFGSHRVRHPFEGRVDTRRRRRFKAETRGLPRAPGVYFFYGLDDRLLYVGKAKCVRERVRWYFADTTLRRSPKLRRLLAEITRLEVEECGSELEALLLERRLIAERQPILNWQHKRYVVYPYLLLTDEEFPRLTLTRVEPRPDNAGADDAEGVETWDAAGFADGLPEDVECPLPLPRQPPPGPGSLPLETPPRAGELDGLYLGPFTTPRAAAWTMEAVRTLFPLRSCAGTIHPDPAGRACFYYDIKRCSGPCVGGTTQPQYADICADLVSLLRTDGAPQLDALKQRMLRLAEEWRFEDAARLKDQLQAIEMVTARLCRLRRMRDENNVVIAQPARRESPDQRALRVKVFLVQGGLVRRCLVVDTWAGLKQEIRDLYSAPPPIAPYTGKTELDDMMILDRWLQAHRDEPCCAWMNEHSSRQWASNAVRQLQGWAHDALPATA